MARKSLQGEANTDLELIVQRRLDRAVVVLQMYQQLEVVRAGDAVHLLKPQPVLALGRSEPIPVVDPVTGEVERTVKPAAEVGCVLACKI